MRRIEDHQPRARYNAENACQSTRKCGGVLPCQHAAGKRHGRGIATTDRTDNLILPAPVVPYNASSRPPTQISPDVIGSITIYFRRFIGYGLPQRLRARHRRILIRALRDT